MPEQGPPSDSATPRVAPDVYAVVTDAPLDRAAVEAFVLSRRDGALVTFEGVIRDHDHGETVSALDYSAHPDAERFLRETCTEVAHETGLAVAAAHRVGALGIGDVALVASVAAPHRAEAFAACALLVDRIKERTPIWKRQHLDGGTSEWVNL
ncbi:molybdenum cofactor biosynthesis protein MoaE [Agromyces binzhouensis]|uniref:Molybdenum cofactor biosynthesis protein MoaE n=2 Tax=Agromyces binzhouensis TaxID=1817495 RepID=A0A4Q2JY51_9MICO|nr:molybdenum cofactor biosynthesis protein MoaE [Agromyces binzhouensis]RXZ51520.1 molybdenum cofactor biosynthesis protein MoaE [Agromyces binzhouensis]